MPCASLLPLIGLCVTMTSIATDEYAMKMKLRIQSRLESLILSQFPCQMREHDCALAWCALVVCNYKGWRFRLRNSLWLPAASNLKENAQSSKYDETHNTDYDADDTGSHFRVLFGMDSLPKQMPDRFRSNR
jgi:hypothetical protein